MTPVGHRRVVGGRFGAAGGPPSDRLDGSRGWHPPELRPCDRRRRDPVDLGASGHSRSANTAHHALFPPVVDPLR